MAAHCGKFLAAVYATVVVDDWGQRMDLGIAGKKAIVCAASKGLGKACAMSLAKNGADLVINARTLADLEATAAEIRAATGRSVTVVAADIGTAEGRASVLAACPAPDILVNNAGGPARGDFEDWDEAAWMQAVNLSMIAPLMLIKAVMDGMCARRFGRIVNITSGTVKMPLPDHALSQGPRAGLTAACAGLARKLAPHNVTINGLLPGQHLTERMQTGLLEVARRSGQTHAEMIAKRVADIPAGRVGDPFEFGEACAFLCSAHSGYIVGQNLLLDGGRFNSTLG
jgi:3-oxoacyl-[acyl-carrier protein] reductase